MGIVRSDGTLGTALNASDRVWAWHMARRWVRSQPQGPWRLRVDADGISAAVGGAAWSFDWSEVTRVVETDRDVLFVLRSTLSGITFVDLPAESLSDADRASIRRWAEAAPGERPWTTYRRRERTFRRLRVASSEAPG